MGFLPRGEKKLVSFRSLRFAPRVHSAAIATVRTRAPDVLSSILRLAKAVDGRDLTRNSSPDLQLPHNERLSSGCSPPRPDRDLLSHYEYTTHVLRPITPPLPLPLLPLQSLPLPLLRTPRPPILPPLLPTTVRGRVLSFTPFHSDTRSLPTSGYLSAVPQCPAVTWLSNTPLRWRRRVGVPVDIRVRVSGTWSVFVSRRVRVDEQIRRRRVDHWISGNRRAVLCVPPPSYHYPYLTRRRKWVVIERAGGDETFALATCTGGGGNYAKSPFCPSTMPNINRLKIHTNVSMRFGRILTLQCKNISKVFPRKRISPNYTSVFANIFTLVFPEAKTKPRTFLHHVRFPILSRQTDNWAASLLFAITRILGYLYFRTDITGNNEVMMIDRYTYKVS